MAALKLALVGCGFVSDYHDSAFGKLKDKIEVVGCCDIVIERARRTAEVLGCERAVTDYRELFPYADAFLIALPHDLHHPVGMDCIRHGKHVLMEKPLALNEAQSLELIHAAEEENVCFMVAYVMRYHPMMVKLKEIIDSKIYGECFQLSIWTEQYTNNYGYYEKEKNGGGQFFNHGCHYIDLMMWFLGNPIKGAHLGTNLGTPWIEAEGTSNCMFEFEGKKLGYHFGTWGARGNRHGYCIHAFFEKGMVECQINDGKVYFHQRRELLPYFETSDQQTLIYQCTAAIHQPEFEMEHFADCVLEKKTPVTSGPVALESLRVIWRMYEAEEKNVIADLRGLSLDVDHWDWAQPGLDKLPNIDW